VIKRQQEKLQTRQTRHLIKDQSGAIAIEYKLIAVGIAIAIIAVVKRVGASLTGTFNKVNSNLN
jgi:pilus assembly protein Flp/PilA